MAQCERPGTTDAAEAAGWGYGNFEGSNRYSCALRPFRDWYTVDQTVHLSSFIQECLAHATLTWTDVRYTQYLWDPINPHMGSC